MLKVFRSIGAVENSPAIYRGEHFNRNFESRQGLEIEHHPLPAINRGAIKDLIVFQTLCRPR